MIAPCRCSGSIQYVHPTCLNAWLIEKYKRNYYATLHKYRNGSTGFKCEVCRYEYQGKLRFVGVLPMLSIVKNSYFTYSLLFNCACVVYLLCKLRSVRRGIGKTALKLARQLKTRSLRSTTSAVLLLCQLFSTGVFLGTINILAFTSIDLTAKLLGKCSSLEVLPFVTE